MLGLVGVTAGALLFVTGAVNGPRMDRAGICHAGHHHNCFEALDGRVVSLGSGFTLRSANSVTVDYDDGRSTTTLALRGDAHPPVRAPVRVELWGGVPVAITDRQGRRYKDALLWPRQWDIWAFVVGGAGLALLLLASAPSIRRSRPR
jgi:hypothetical protein